jgi:hypothetical protein
MKHQLTFIACIVLTIIPRPLLAWSEAGHAIITLMAYDMLTKEEQSKFISLIRTHPRYASDFQPPEKTTGDENSLRWQIGRVGYWPDVARRQPQYDRPKWHYELGASLILGDADKLKVPSRPEGLPADATLDTQSLYISQAFQLNRQVMANKSQPDEDRAVAMCWIAHLVADAHQPCHAGSLYMEGVFVVEDGDRGANRIPTKQRQNLHALWDQLLGNKFNQGDVRRRMSEIHAKHDLQQLDHVELSTETNGFQAWLQESRELAVEHVYSQEIIETLERVRRGLVDEPEKIDLSEEYLKSAGAIAQQRAMQAAIRLRSVLSECLN